MLLVTLCPLRLGHAQERAVSHDGALSGVVEIFRRRHENLEIRFREEPEQKSATVAIECGYGYRKFGADESKPLGETEFLENVALQARSDSRIKTHVAAAIAGFAASVIRRRGMEVVHFGVKRPRGCSSMGGFARVSAGLRS